MKKLSLWVSALILCAMTFQSCCVTKVTSVTKTADPKTADVYADLDIRTNKITHVYRVTIENHQLGINEDDLKSNAVFEALKNIGADVLVAPQFLVEKYTCLRETDYEITVIGYPAFYINMRQGKIAEKTEMKELKEGATYIIVKKSEDDQVVEVDRDLIVTPKPGGDCKLDINDTEVDHVVLKGECKHKK